RYRQLPEIAVKNTNKIKEFIEIGVKIADFKKTMEKNLLEIGILMLFNQFEKDDTKKTLEYITGKALLGKEIFLKKKDFILYYRENIFPALKNLNIREKDILCRNILKKDVINSKFINTLLLTTFLCSNDLKLKDDLFSAFNEIFNNFSFPTVKNAKDTKYDLIERISMISGIEDDKKFFELGRDINLSRNKNIEKYLLTIQKNILYLYENISPEWVKYLYYNDSEITANISDIKITNDRSKKDIGYNLTYSAKKTAEIFMLLNATLRTGKSVNIIIDKINDPIIKFVIKLYKLGVKKDDLIAVFNELIPLIVEIDKFTGENSLVLFRFATQKKEKFVKNFTQYGLLNTAELMTLLKKKFN
ncbi:MAG: hypothetical protein KAS39_01980, partial [Actinomycetia bacterium]|nr:hypothetical protein [Actinomycetes bacterium]